MQGALTGNTVNRRMIHLRSRPDIRNTAEYLCITADNPAGEKARQNDSAAGSCTDFKHSAAGKVHAVYRDGIAADGIDYALCIRTGENGLCHRSLPDGQMIRLTFLQAVLDGVAAFIAHGIAAHAVVLPKPMRKPVFIIVFHGLVPQPELPAYLAQMDVCLNVFRAGALSKDVSPLKFYEYLATGKPIVSTREPLQVEDFKDVVYIARNPEMFLPLCDAAAKENRPAWTEKRLAYGAQCSWTERVHQMEEVLYKKGVLHESAEE